MNESLDIASATGVDVQLRVAGPGARSYAFVIDWHVRLLLALAWFAAASLLAFGTLQWAPEITDDFASYSFIVVLPAFALYFLYHPVLEIALVGSTPGKRMAGVRIVTLEGRRPSLLAHLIRNALRMLDSLPAAYIVGLVSCILTKRSVRIGDLAAGTLLVYERDNRGTTRDAPSFNPAAINHYGLNKVELASELLERWDQLDEERRETMVERVLTAMEPELQRAPGAAAQRAQLQQLLENPGKVIL